MILAIDPGTVESAYVVLNDSLRPVRFEKVDNNRLLEYIVNGDFNGCNHVGIEMVASYGMPVGSEIFDTCVWIGRFKQTIINELGIDPKYIYRKDEALNLCNNSRAGDSNITQALIDRFAPGVRNFGKGTKKEPGWFYGFKTDVWAAYAVGITCYDLHVKGNK